MRDLSEWEVLRVWDSEKLQQEKDTTIETFKQKAWMRNVAALCTALLVGGWLPLDDAHAKWWSNWEGKHNGLFQSVWGTINGMVKIDTTHIDQGHWSRCRRWELVEDLWRGVTRRNNIPWQANPNTVKTCFPPKYTMAMLAHDVRAAAKREFKVRWKWGKKMYPKNNPTNHRWYLTIPKPSLGFTLIVPMKSIFWRRWVEVKTAWAEV